MVFSSNVGGNFEGVPHSSAMVAALDTEELGRFRPIFPPSAEIPRGQSGWWMAVLPFGSLGASHTYGIALGMAEEISAALSRFRSPRLIAPATFWDGVGPAADVMGRCRLYNLDYVIDGTIEVIDDQVRVNVTLLDVVLDFEVIWSGRFQGPFDDLSHLEQGIAAKIISQLDPDLFKSGPVSDAPARAGIASAHHLVLTAIQGIFRLDRFGFIRAREFLARAIELDPAYAAAHAWMAYWCVMAVGQGWVSDPRDVTTAAGISAECAVRLDPADARAIAIAGHVKGYLFHDVQAALKCHAQAIELNPNLPIAWTLSSWSKIYNGEHATAIRHAVMSQSLSPRDPHLFFVQHALMTAQFFRRQLDEADMLAEIVLAQNPGHASALNVRLAILGHMSRKEEAAECLAELRKIEPKTSVGSIVSRAPLRPADKAFYTKGLLLAGVAQ